MTPEQIEQHRKRFEQLYIRRSGCFPSMHPQNDRLYINQTEILWSGYLMCAENIEVELPPPNEGDFYLDGMIDYDHTVEYIESQGIKVKP